MWARISVVAMALALAGCAQAPPRPTRHETQIRAQDEARANEHRAWLAQHRREREEFVAGMKASRVQLDGSKATCDEARAAGWPRPELLQPCTELFQAISSSFQSEREWLREHDQIEQEHERTRSAEEMRAADAIYAERMERLEADRADRARRAAVAQSLANAFAAPAATSAPAAAAPSGGCSSDYACGLGFVCVKPNFSITGSCARAVDSNGIQQYGRPADPGSIGVKMPASSDCRFDTECPISFRCDSKSGACLKR